MSIKEKQNELVEEFSFFEDWEDRYKLIIDKAKRTPEIPADQRIPKNKIDGCQSQVWIYPEMKEGKLNFYIDSDAILVKGIAAMVAYVFSNSTPDEILTTEVFFVDKLGIAEHLSPTRKNGLSAMLKQVKLYAIAFKALGK